MEKMTPFPFDKDLCYMYVTSRGFHHVVVFIKCLMLYITNNIEGARNTQTLGGNAIISSEILLHYSTYTRIVYLHVQQSRRFHLTMA